MMYYPIEATLFTEQMFDLAETNLIKHCFGIVVEHETCKFINLGFLLPPKADNEDKSIFDLRMESELFQRRISEPGGLL